MTLATCGIDLNVTFVKASTQKGKNLISAFRNSTKGDSIFKAYAKPSQKKIEAFYEIKKEMQEKGGDKSFIVF